jgi:transposase-like protein
MAQIIKNYTSLEKYEQDVKYNPEGLKPSTCKECGCNNIWCNSFYERAVSGRCANRQKADPIAILRFKCSRCKNHYSVLPSIIPLLRWYLWCMQQWVLSMVLNGYSMQKAAKEAEVNRKTVSRWYHWLKNKFKIFCVSRTQIPLSIMMRRIFRPSSVGVNYLILLNFYIRKICLSHIHWQPISN